MAMLKTCLVMGVLSFMSGTAQATIYKWVDENNQTHYSQQPVQGAKRIKTQKAPTAVSPAAEINTLKAKLTDQEQQTQANEQAAENEKNIQKVKAFNCKLAKERFASLDQPRVKEKTVDGFRLLSEDERQARLAKTKLEINQYCESSK